MHFLKHGGQGQNYDHSHTSNDLMQWNVLYENKNGISPDYNQCWHRVWLIETSLFSRVEETSNRAQRLWNSTYSTLPGTSLTTWFLDISYKHTDCMYAHICTPWYMFLLGVIQCATANVLLQPVGEVMKMSLAVMKLHLTLPSCLSEMTSYEHFLPNVLSFYELK